MVKVVSWTIFDAEARKRGERTGLDILVVHALNDGYLVVRVLIPALPEQMH